MLQISQSYLQLRENSLDAVPKFIFLSTRSCSILPIASTYFDCERTISLTQKYLLPIGSCVRLIQVR